MRRSISEGAVEVNQRA